MSRVVDIYSRLSLPNSYSFLFWGLVKKEAVYIVKNRGSEGDFKSILVSYVKFIYNVNIIDTANKYRKACKNESCRDTEF